MSFNEKIQHTPVSWPAPGWVRAMSTKRQGGVSQGPWTSLNLGEHCGDIPDSVHQNRRLIYSVLGGEPLWLRQVHGAQVVGEEPLPLEADARVIRSLDVRAGILTADCLAVLFCHRTERVVAAAHAGWRGLACGVLEKTVSRMEVNPADILVWLSPAIGPSAFEVGEDVRQIFLKKNVVYAKYFMEHRVGHWLLDIFALTRHILLEIGIGSVYGGGLCTVLSSQEYFSYRRDQGVTGRMGSFIWIVENFSGERV